MGSLQNTSPIFATVFRDQWNSLPVVLKKHYSNRPYSADQVIVRGVLDVKSHGIINLVRPFYRLLGTIPVVTENDVPVTVNFVSSPDSDAFHFDRIFYFQSVRPYVFRSTMYQEKDNQVIEMMRLGICWRTEFGHSDGKITMRHRGYALKALGITIPLPLTLIFGRVDAEEIAVDEDHFDMKLEMTHRLFGLLYTYSGRFKVVSQA